MCVVIGAFASASESPTPQIIGSVLALSTMPRACAQGPNVSDTWKQINPDLPTEPELTRLIQFRRYCLTLPPLDEQINSNPRGKAVFFAGVLTESSRSLRRLSIDSGQCIRYQFSGRS